jgi:hypothetical protein
MKKDSNTRRVTLELGTGATNWLEFIHQMTNESYTCICRTAIHEYLSNIMSNYEYNTVHSIEKSKNKDLLNALNCWEFFNRRFDTMTPDQVRIFKMVAWELLITLKQKNRYVLISEACDSLKIKYPLELAPFLMHFFNQQRNYFSHNDIIPDNETDTSLRDDVYHDKKWGEYGNNLNIKKKEYEKQKTNTLRILQLTN